MSEVIQITVLVICDGSHATTLGSMLVYGSHQIKYTLPDVCTSEYYREAIAVVL